MLTGVRKQWISKEKELEGTNLMERKMKIREEGWRIITICNREGMKEKVKQIEEMKCKK